MSETAADRWGGIWPAVMTPLDADERPEPNRLASLVRRFVDAGVDGLYLLGSTGQGPLLTADERRVVAERAVDAAGGAVPVMVHVGAPSTREAVALAEHAAGSGADAVASVPPYFYPVGREAVFAHYAAVGRAAGKPFFVYHLGALRGLDAAPEAYARRLLEIPHVAGIKYTDRDLHGLAGIARAAAARLTVFSGADEQMCQAALSGAHGAIGSFFNVCPVGAQKARRAFLRGDFDAGFRFMSALGAVIDEAIASGSIWNFLRPAMRRRWGIELGPLRAPLGTGIADWPDASVDAALRRIDDASPA